MTQVLIVDLKDKIAGGASLEFLRVEVPVEPPSPFVLVRVSFNGQEVESGFVIDTDKQIFLDHLAQKDQEDVLKKAAPAIVELLSKRSSEQVIPALEYLVGKGDVFIRKMPKPVPLPYLGKIEVVVYGTNLKALAVTFADSISEGIIAAATELAQGEP